MVLNRMRFPRIIQMAGRDLGALGEMIMEEVVVHGRLSVGSVRKKIADKLEALRDRQEHDPGLPDMPDVRYFLTSVHEFIPGNGVFSLAQLILYVCYSS